MLKALTVSNFALIDHTRIEFAEGLNILTGETGAGKSILIDAFGAVLGERASIDSIRKDCDYFRVEAVVNIAGWQAMQQLLDEQGIPWEEDTLIISRRLTRHGKNTALANGCQVPLAVLRQIGALLVDMHGQHENQALLRAETYLDLVDHFAEPIKYLLDEYKAYFQEWTQVVSKLKNLENRSRERERQMEMLTWQTEEIEQAALQVGEDERLEQEIHRLTNIEKISHAVTRSHVLLKQGDKGISSVIAGLAEIKRELDTASRYDLHLGAQLTIVTECLYQLEDVSTELRQYVEEIDFEPGRLQEMEERMNVIHTLKKKYGSTIAEILEYHQKAYQELADLEHADQTSDTLKQREAQLLEKIEALANSLHTQRRQAAQALSQAVTSHLKELGMTNAVFTVQVRLTEQYTASGRNEVACLFSANRGEDPKLLSKVASGGELSRVALAIKSVNAYRDSVGTVIFDEIDAGIGGNTAQMVAEKIAVVAMEKQVLCITHSPPIASMADVHYLVEKYVDGEKTCTRVRQLVLSERILELARMVAGDNMTPIAIDNARQMIEMARKKKEKMIKRA